MSTTETLESLLLTLRQEKLSPVAYTTLKKLEKLIKKKEKENKGENPGKSPAKTIPNKFDLRGQVALVTGGSRGIGYGLAQALGEAGCKVAIASQNGENAQKAAERLRSEKGIETLAIEVDVSKKESVDGMIETVLNHWGDLHIGINNAGVADCGPGEEFPEDRWDALMNVNLKGVFLCCQGEARHMLKKGYGRIVNIASISGQIVGTPQSETAYNTSKAGVMHLTKSLAAEWATNGVTVNSISPGYIETDMTTGEEFATMREKWLSMIPMNRMGQVEELAGAALWLASPSSSYTTGSDLVIDGGYLLW